MSFASTLPRALLSLALVAPAALARPADLRSEAQTTSSSPEGGDGVISESPWPDG